MTETKFKGKVYAIDEHRIYFEFGATQVDMGVSATGTHARKLKLKSNDKVEVTIRKL